MIVSNLNAAYESYGKKNCLDTPKYGYQLLEKRILFLIKVSIVNVWFRMLTHIHITKNEIDQTT